MCYKNILFSFSLFLTSFSLFSQGSALHFDGTDDYINFSGLSLDPYDFTFECWMRSETVSSGNGHLRLIGFEDFEFEVADHNNDLRFYDGGSWRNTGVVIRDSKMHHIATVRDGADIRIYVDGQERFAYTYNGYFDMEKTGYIGRAQLTCLDPEFFKGIIDEIRFWSVARTAAEIQSVWDQELTGSEANLALYYNMNTPNGTIATDVSGNNLNGTLHGNSGTNPNGPVYTTSSYPYNANAIHQIPSADLASLLVNPVRTELILSTEILEGQALIYGMNGALLKQENVSGATTINVADLPSGLYVLQIVTDKFYQSIRFEVAK